ncbi:uncharacterized protein LOC129106325 [Anoplopoma fimbria]|uniref:uncharacterized protein LOC129106325 n=1 Tax=Anoplopoma fimbria TaxID=229290 RepID=UPI0023EC9410|nr:uncharacterized protein LOC129106325 [Anoplopoma fimbria]
MMSSQDKDEVLVVLYVEWSNDNRPRYFKEHLQRILQVWFNRNITGADCTVLNASTDRRVVVKITPARVLNQLRKLTGQTLSSDDGRAVTITSVSLTQPELETDSSLNFTPSFVSEPHDVEVQVEEQNSDMLTCTCNIPMHHFWYVNQAYKEEIQCIEKESGVKIIAEVKLTFKADQKDGSPNYAFSEFINLVQKCSGESRGFTVPLKKVNPEDWKDTVNIIQRKDNKLLLTVSSEEMTVCGPRQSQDAIRKSLNATANTSTFVGESQDTSPNIDMSIKDPLVDAGLTMEENYWRLMTTSFNKQVAKIKTKFAVDFKESSTSQGKVKVKVCYKKSGGNASMESHAVRALLHLYQKVATSPLSLFR